MSRQSKLSGFFSAGFPLFDMSINPNHRDNSHTAEVTERSHFPLTTDSGILMYPVLPVDPDIDLQVELFHRNMNNTWLHWDLTNHVWLTIPPIKTMNRKGPSRQNGLAYFSVKNGWNILARQI